MSEAHPHDGLGDVGPGYIEATEYSIREGLQGYVLGLILAALLTIASFYIVGAHWVWGPGIPVALAVLAIAQIGVHLVFFLHLTSAPDNTNNILALAFGVMIVVLVVGGSLWIMANLNENMYPMAPMPR
jgi:cytochrome o ubiquinol oxidase operon protein cyoD